MGFYYLSLSSLFLLSVVYTVLLLLFLGIARVTRGMPGRRALLGVVGTVFLILPIAEELWIAWHFGQACKQAGTFIHKKVEVEGFYDDTTGWGPRQLAESNYKFMESKDLLKRRLLRVEAASAAARDGALAWYAEKVRNKQPVEGPFVVQPVSDKEQVVVSPNKTDAWRVTIIDRPTARYQFSYSDPPSGTPWGHKIVRSGSVVIDKDADKEIARYVSFGRGAPWFYIGLDVPGFACDAPGRWPYTRNSRLVYEKALIPAVQK